MDDRRSERQTLCSPQGDRDAQQADQGRLLSQREPESLPFDAELERRPVWVDIASALVIVSALAAAARLVPIAVILPFLIASSIGRRFGSVAIRVVVTEEGSLELGSRFISHAEVRDVWLDDDGVDSRVVVAYGKRPTIAPLWFENREQARRFANALSGGEVIAGYRPRPADLLASLRFVGVALAFFGVGSWYGGFALVFTLLGLRGYLSAKQLIVHAETFELRTGFDSETFRRDSIQKIDIDDGVITLKERELEFTVTNARDVHLTSPLWTDAIRRRALRVLSRPVQKAEGPTSADPSSGVE